MDLREVGLYPNERYETIYTTISSENNKNAAPIGVKIINNNGEIGTRLFPNTTTLKNILEKKEFVINITNNPKIFTQSTISNLNEDYFTEDKDLAILKDCDAYLIAKVKEIKKNEEPYIIKSQVTDLVINNPCAQGMNRGIHCLIESLVNYTRINIVDKEKRQYYIDRFKENERIINKVASEDTKEAMKILKEAMNLD